MCIPACMYVAYFSTFYNLLINTVWIHQLIGGGGQGGGGTGIEGAESG